MISRQGIVTVEMLRKEWFSTHYIPDVFTPAYLIQLFQHLLIIAWLSSTKCFMPSLSRMISPEEVSKQLSSQSSSAARLLVHWMCSKWILLCFTSPISVSGWKFAEGTPYCLFFFVTVFASSFYYTVSSHFFELRVKAPNFVYPELCPMIWIAIYLADWKQLLPLQLACFCKCSLSHPHTATPTIQMMKTSTCYALNQLPMNLSLSTILYG